jgi:hypothetical protein
VEASKNDVESEARLIACTQLVEGCEGAFFGLLAREEQDAAPRRAAMILAKVLSSMRGELETLRGSRGTGAMPATIANSLDRWTSDELFTEALRREGGDTGALRDMQSRTLRALIAATG